jgi:hypothetical protein
MAPTMSPLLRCPAETNVVTDDGSRSDREGLGVSDVQLFELDFVPPHLPQKVLENLYRQLLARAATTSKAEWREAGVIAHRKRLAVDDAVDGAKSTVMQRRLSSILDLERRLLEGAFRESDLLTLRLIDLVAWGYKIVSIRIELLWILPLHGVEARGLMGG